MFHKKGKHKYCMCLEDGTCQLLFYLSTLKLPQISYSKYNIPNCLSLLKSFLLTSYIVCFFHHKLGGVPHKILIKQLYPLHQLTIFRIISLLSKILFYKVSLYSFSKIHVLLDMLILSSRLFGSLEAFLSLFLLFSINDTYKVNKTWHRMFLQFETLKLK